MILLDVGDIIPSKTSLAKFLEMLHIEWFCN